MLLEAKDPYLRVHLETQSRTIVDRDQNGSISISFNPRPDQPVVVGGLEIKSPKQLNGDLIEIGSFRISREQSDKEFMEAVKSWDLIMCKCLTTDPK